MDNVFAVGYQVSDSCARLMEASTWVTRLISRRETTESVHGSYYTEEKPNETLPIGGGKNFQWGHPELL